MSYSPSSDERKKNCCFLPCHNSSWVIQSSNKKKKIMLEIGDEKLLCMWISDLNLESVSLSVLAFHQQVHLEREEAFVITLSSAD